MIATFFEKMPRVIGHRGAKGLAPENTLASFDAAANAGASSIEVDVTVTKDNHAVIHHDMDLKRCTDGEGPLLLQTLDEIRRLDAGIKFSSEFTGQKIPTLQETLDWVSSHQMSLNLEVKPCDGWQIPTADIVGKELRGTVDPGFPILLSSFNIEALIATGKWVPHFPKGYLTDAIPPDWEKRLHDCGAASLHCQQEFATPDIIAAVQAAGFKFLVYTVNDVGRAKQLLDWNVDAIITDFPDQILPLTA